MVEAKEIEQSEFMKNSCIKLWKSLCNIIIRFGNSSRKINEKSSIAVKLQ